MNWIAQKFEELKKLVEEHIPASNKRLDELEARVADLETDRYKRAASSFPLGNPHS